MGVTGNLHAAWPAFKSQVRKWLEDEEVRERRKARARRKVKPKPCH